MNFKCPRVKLYIAKILSVLQFFILNFSFYVLSIYFKAKKDRKETLKRRFVIGVDEIAMNIYSLKEVLGDAYSVSLTSHPFYKIRYDFKLSNQFLRFIMAPLMLSYLAHIADIFIYIWHTGFIFDRKYDFIFLKKKNKKIVTIFVGDDIRSLKNCKEYYKNLDRDCHCNYYGWINPIYKTEAYERSKKEIADCAERYSDLIIGSQFGQFSYIKRKIYPYVYMIDINRFNFNKSKFDMMENNLVVLHAPSSPFIKGTPLVRAAIKKLQSDGYRFKYIELTEVAHSMVKEILSESHIVLNQFYGLNPGLFGIEAMASGTAVLMSADPNVNTELPESGKQAWLITGYWEIYDKLKLLLDNPEQIKEYAIKGREFVSNHYTLEKAREYFFDIFEKEGII